MRYLITGGCGFIGVNLIDLLLEKTDAEMIVLDNLSEGRESDLPDTSRVTFVKGDITKKEDVDRAIDGCSAVVNLAAQTGVVPSMDDPATDARINVLGFLNVLLAARDAKINRVVHASSAAPVGEQEMPIHEEKLPSPMSPYAASKLSGEGYASAFAHSFGMNTVVLRFSNAYGPRSYHKGSVIAKFMKRVQEGKPLVVYGDGEQTRDFVHVKDISTAIYKSMTCNLEGFNLFQIGTGVETSINQLVELFKQHFDVPVSYEEPRAGEMVRNFADISKARRMLGYEPTIGLDKGLEETFEWFRKYLAEKNA